MSEIHPQVRVVVKPYGSALPLGFFAFGVGMFLLAALGAGWVKPEEGKTTGLLLVAFVFPLEFLGTVIAFLARDTVAAAALGVFATSWLATGLVLYTGKPGVLSAAFGYYLVALTVVTLALGVAALLGKPLIAAILLLAGVRSLLAAVYELGGGQGWERVAGWIALAIFVVAMYGGLAFMLEDSLGRRVLPVFRIGGSREAIEGDLSDQLRGLGDEAGVRHTL
jgi:succinate-acetate transporter protein